MENSKIVQIAVSNDIQNDQRVLKTANTLVANGYKVHISGRIKPDSNNKAPKLLHIYFYRFRMLFHANAFFYAEWNIRLFIWFLFKKTDLFWSNDLDTLPAVYLAAKLRNKPIIFDSHEYFTEVPELANSKFAKSVWKFFEKSIVPHLKYCFTVNDSIAQLFKKEYATHFEVLRNVPLASQFKTSNTAITVDLPKEKFIIIMQGSGINIQRGAEELLKSAQYLSDDCLIVFIGGGDVYLQLKTMAVDEKYKNKVLILDKMPYPQLIQYTKASNLGASLDRASNINYKYSLPNKLFDYIHAGIPTIASDLVEVKKIITHYEVGKVVAEVSPKAIAAAIMQYKNNTVLYQAHKHNTRKVAEKLCWEYEQQKITNMLSAINTNYSY